MQLLNYNANAPINLNVIVINFYGLSKKTFGVIGETFGKDIK